jgi:type IV pilus assembly protein PilY1
LGGTGVANWKNDNSSPAPLFTATDSSNTLQPITVKPEVGRHPTEADSSGTGANLPNLMVYFGTGQYLTNADPSNTNTQSFYGVWDKEKTSQARTSLTRNDLQPQGFVSGADNQVLEDNPVDWGTQNGWYIDLPDTGERVVVDPVLRGNVVFFNSVVPETTSLCSGGGTGAEYAVDIVNGGRPDEPTFDVNNDGVVDLADRVGTAGNEMVAGRQTMTGVPSSPIFTLDRRYTGVTEGTGRQETLVHKLETAGTGRLSWQELERP